jgi:hypothetical protein
VSFRDEWAADARFTRRRVGAGRHRQQRLEVDHVLSPGLAQFRINLGFEGFDPHPLHMELEPGALPVMAQLLTTIKDAEDGLGNSQVVLDGDEFAQDQRRPGEDRGAPAYLDREATPFLASLCPDSRDEAEVLDGGNAVVLQQEKEDLNLRDSRWVTGWRRKWRA